MSGPGSSEKSLQSVKVTLQVYDFLEQGLNGILRQIGTGGFHCGVEVFGKEWSFRRTHFGTGVFWIAPRSCTAHKHRESVPMGKVSISVASFNRLIEEFKRDWPGTEYDILKRNCCVFSNEFCKRLGVGPIPDWITNLAGVGADMRSVVRRPLRQIEGAITGETPDKEKRKPARSPENSAVEVPRRPCSSGYDELKLTDGPCVRKVCWDTTDKALCGAIIGLSIALVLVGGCCIAAATGKLKASQFNYVGGTRPPAWPAWLPWVDETTTTPPTPTWLGTYAPGYPLTPNPQAGGVLFDCSLGLDTWRVDWSAEKLGWCCLHEDSRCPVAHGVSLFDCAEDFSQRAFLWSAAKKEWCCRHDRIGCGQASLGGHTGFSTTLGPNGSLVAGSVPAHSSGMYTGNSTDAGQAANAPWYFGAGAGNATRGGYAAPDGYTTGAATLTSNTGSGNDTSAGYFPTYPYGNGESSAVGNTTIGGYGASTPYDSSASAAPPSVPVGNTSEGLYVYPAPYYGSNASALMGKRTRYGVVLVGGAGAGYTVPDPYVGTGTSESTGDRGANLPYSSGSPSTTSVSINSSAATPSTLVSNATRGSVANTSGSAGALTVQAAGANRGFSAPSINTSASTGFPAADDTLLGVSSPESISWPAARTGGTAGHGRGGMNSSHNDSSTPSAQLSTGDSPGEGIRVLATKGRKSDRTGGDSALTHRRLHMLRGNAVPQRGAVT